MRNHIKKNIILLKIDLRSFYRFENITFDSVLKKIYILKKIEKTHRDFS